MGGYDENTTVLFHAHNPHNRHNPGYGPVIDRLLQSYGELCKVMEPITHF